MHEHPLTLSHEHDRCHGSYVTVAMASSDEIAALRLGIELGMTVIDTAEM